MTRSPVRCRATPRLCGSILAFVAISLFATPALAKDICVGMSTSGFGPLTYVFRSPKIPKAGKLTSVVAVVFPGTGFLGNTPGVAQGTIYGKSDGKLRIGLALQGLLASGLVDDHVLDDALVDRSFIGANLIVLPSNATLSGTWSRVDCKTITLP